MVFFLFKQKTAYEWRISDWSSDVCSSDLWRRREGIDELVDRLRAAHPGLRANAAHPVGETRHEAEILDDVLFADQPHRDNATGSDGDGRTEEAFEHEDALGMVAKRTMAKRTEEHTTELQSIMGN